MPFLDYLLYRIAKSWPSPVEARNKQFGAAPGTDEYNLAYARSQFDRCVSRGLGIAVRNQDVLELACGHGGFSCFMATAGARSVVGIDLDSERLEFAEILAKEVAKHLGVNALSVSFHEMNAESTAYGDESFDLVVAPNAFEHFTKPKEVTQEALRVLRPGGRLYVPVFSSIYNPYGLHLKHGLKVPSANLFFSEKTIVRAMHRLAKDRPALLEIYPGLRENPECVRELRKYGDLNDITFARFKRMVQQIGFQIESFTPFLTIYGKIIKRLPCIRNTFLLDAFAHGASALLKKPAHRGQ